MYRSDSYDVRVCLLVSKLVVVWNQNDTVSSLPTGLWSSPPTTGYAPPPCQGMSFVRVDENRVVLSGGYDPETRRRLKDVYVLDTESWVSAQGHTCIPRCILVCTV